VSVSMEDRVAANVRRAEGRAELVGIGAR
jgi:hypothetical protein